MKLRITWLLVLAWGLAVGFPAYSGEPSEEDAPAVAEIEKLGVHVRGFMVLHESERRNRPHVQTRPEASDA